MLLALPVILYQLYAFVLPAFSPSERRVALPLLLLVPFLFIAGVVFGYFVVLDRAVDFLLNFNDEQFNIQVRAREYYSFVVADAAGDGAGVPGTAGDPRRHAAGHHDAARSCGQRRRYAYLGIAVLAALLPTVDPVTMLIEMVPLIVLFELSIVLAALLGRPPGEPAPSEPRAEGSPLTPDHHAETNSMLFDLKGKRKRLVQVVYLGLAILFGGGLVLFGVGGNVSGGLIDAFKGTAAAQTRAPSATWSSAPSAARPPTRATQRRWLAVLRAQFNLASSPEGSDAETGQLTDRGQQAIIEVAQAWERYLRLKPKKIDPSAASFAALAYGALQDYDKAVETQRSP